MRIKADDLKWNHWLVVASGKRVRLKKLGIEPDGTIRVKIGGDAYPYNAGGYLGFFMPDHDGMIELGEVAGSGPVTSIEPREGNE